MVSLQEVHLAIVSSGPRKAHFLEGDSGSDDTNNVHSVLTCSQQFFVASVLRG